MKCIYCNFVEDLALNKDGLCNVCSEVIKIKHIDDTIKALIRRIHILDCYIANFENRISNLEYVNKSIVASYH